MRPALTFREPALPRPLPPLQGLNRATNAFLKWALGGDDRYQAWLAGVMEMPKVGG